MKKLLVVLVVLCLVGLAFTPAKVVLSTPQSRIEYLQKLGYSVTGEESAERIIIPTEFNAVYQNYNALQKKAGFDLRHFQGKSVIIYTLPVQEKLAHLILCEDQLIGGDICDVSFYGTMLPLLPSPQ